MRKQRSGSTVHARASLPHLDGALSRDEALAEIIQRIDPQPDDDQP